MSMSLQLMYFLWKYWFWLLWHDICSQRIHEDIRKIIPKEIIGIAFLVSLKQSGITSYHLKLCWSAPLRIFLWRQLERRWLQTQTYWQHYSGIKSLFVCLRFCLEDITFWFLCSSSFRTLNTSQIPGLDSIPTTVIPTRVIHLKKISKHIPQNINDK